MPSRKNPEIRSWLHWLLTNVKGTDLSTATIIQDYEGPAPPKGSGPHRYILLIFEQANGEEINVSPISQRPNFNIQEFIEGQKFSEPLAGNFFLSENKA